MRERKIGEQFEYNGHTLKCEKKECMCEGCFFDTENIACNGDMMDVIGRCYGKSRSDQTDVIFKLIK